MQIILYIPKLDDYWYEEKLHNDKLTMEYNAGWDVSYNGYNYEDGTIEYSEEKKEENFKKRKINGNYFAYILDENLNEFVGYCNYTTKDGKTICGILIECKFRGLGYSKEGLSLLLDIAKKNGINEIYDDFEEDRIGNKIFYDLGFVKNKEYFAKKFNKEIKLIEVRKDLV